MKNSTAALCMAVGALIAGFVTDNDKIIIVVPVYISAFLICRAIEAKNRA